MLKNYPLDNRIKKYFSLKLRSFISLSEWFTISIVIAICVGSSSALFLYSLEYVTDLRIENNSIIILLPIAGLLIGIIFSKWGKKITSGNNLITDNIHNPNKIIQFRMAPLILFGTLITHLFGGSAGREGTAIQMGGAIADQFTKLLKLGKNRRKIILICGMSAGFGSIFGTPFAGAIFGLEVYHVGKLRYNAIFPAVSEMWDNGKYNFFKSNNNSKTSQEMVTLWKVWINKYPIILLEDGMSENDWEGWKLLTNELGTQLELVGDDIF